MTTEHDLNALLEIYRRRVELTERAFSSLSLLEEQILTSVFKIGPSSSSTIRIDTLVGDLIVSGDKRLGDRRVRINGSVSGSAVVTGDENATYLRSQDLALPLPESVDIRAELATLHDLLDKLKTDDHQKIVNALAEALADTAKSQVDKEDIGSALERALLRAGKATDFGEITDKAAPHVRNAVTWLGEEWHRLLSLVSREV